MGSAIHIFADPQKRKAVLFSQPPCCFPFCGHSPGVSRPVSMPVAVSVLGFCQMFRLLPGCMPMCIVISTSVSVTKPVSVVSDLMIWSGPVSWSCILVLYLYLAVWSGLVLLSGQMYLVRALLYISIIYLLANLIRWVFDNICVRKMITTLNAIRV